MIKQITKNNDDLGNQVKIKGRKNGEEKTSLYMFFGFEQCNKWPSHTRVPPMHHFFKCHDFIHN